MAAIIIGAIVGIAFKEKAAVLKPFGDIFLNLLFVVIVPLIFLSITTSIAKIKQPKRLGKDVYKRQNLISYIISPVINIVSTGIYSMVSALFGIFKL